MRTETLEDHTFLPAALGENDVVLDLGANVGRFSHAMIHRFGCRCIAVEPSPSVFRSIPDHERLMKVNCAVAGKDAPLTFHVSANSEASAVVADAEPAGMDTLTVEGRTVESLCRAAGVSRISLMKVDIEGLEIAVLDSCSDEFLRSVGQITVEFHDFCHLTALTDIVRVSSRLRRLGFWQIRMTRESYLDTLFVNRTLAGISPAQFVYLRYVERNWRGIQRIARRFIGAHRS